MINQGLVGRAGQEGVRPLLVAHLLMALVLWLACYPFVDQLRHGDLIDASLLTLVLLTAVPAVGGRRGTLLAAIVIVAPAVATKWLDHLWPGLISKEFMFAAAIVFLVFVMVNLLRFILHAPRVNAEVLCAAAANYLLVALLWAMAYALVARLVPHSFEFTVKADPYRAMDRFECLYFSFGAMAKVCKPFTLAKVHYFDSAEIDAAWAWLAQA